MNLGSQIKLKGKGYKTILQRIGADKQEQYTSTIGTGARFAKLGEHNTNESQGEAIHINPKEIPSKPISTKDKEHQQQTYFNELERVTAIAHTKLNETNETQDK